MMKDDRKLILLLETSTVRCSAALSADGEIIGYRETSEPRAHAASLAPFVKELLEEAGVDFGMLDAVAVSGGPGSYTGLRVGVSTAKGICFGSSRPLISVGTLELLAYQALASGAVTSGSLIVPMVDARRMEVYTCQYSSECEPLSDCEAKILDADSFVQESSLYRNMVFIGDGVEKYRQFLVDTDLSGRLAGCTFLETCPDAKAMAIPALKKLEAGIFEDSAYYEPFYLKEFVAGVSKKSVL